MNKNMGTTDKLIRIVVAIIISVLYFTGIISGTIGVIALVAGGIFLLTSVISICPLYSIFGLNTCKIPKK
ncbi:DUF2892 domain-containing protein [Lutibacter holmesii]|uniref:DUF2892 domain-containing protein n=1 Tax=Lutibacter holmesii TaxID=1137985 RepID=A0ABW3WLJ3_9FLAO